MRHIGLSMRTITLFYLICAVFIPFPSQAQVSNRANALNVHDVWQAFQDNRIEAEESYLNKGIKVRGIVIDTGVSIYATPTVTLSMEEEGETRAICVLPRSDFNKLSAFKKGQDVVVMGRGYAFGKNGLIIKECKEVE